MARLMASAIGLVIGDGRKLKGIGLDREKPLPGAYKDKEYYN